MFCELFDPRIVSGIIILFYPLYIGIHSFDMSLTKEILHIILDLYKKNV